MEIKRLLLSPARAASTAAAVLLAAATASDALRLAHVPVSPTLGYFLGAAAIVAAAAGVLLRVLSRRVTRARNTIELAVTGLVLLAWWLRGHPGIPADPPIVAAEFLAACVLAGTARYRRRRAPVERHSAPRR